MVQWVSRVFLLSFIVSVVGCPTVNDDAGTRDDVIADAGDHFVTCVEEDECAFLGEGAMCMGGWCMGMDPAPVVEVPAPTRQDTTVQRLIDLNPDDAVFEANLSVEAQSVMLVDGKMTDALVYRDPQLPPTVPGPLIDVVEGTTVIIHVTNFLDEPTTVHWHGLVLPNAMDGVPDMPMAPIAPGETYTYTFVAKNPALYWYHPHFRSDEQNERGLHGPFLIRKADEPVVDEERILVIDDLLVNEEGSIAGPEVGPAHVEHEDGSLTMTFTSMMGRQGNRLLVNGKQHPLIDVRPGTIERWRIANTANARFFQLAIAGATLTKIGDDAGLLSTPVEVDRLLLAPSERVDVLVRFGAVAQTSTLKTEHYNRGHTMPDPGAFPLVTFNVAGDARVPLTDTPVVSGDVEKLPEAASVTHVLEMQEGMVRGGRVGFFFNDELWPDVTPLESVFGNLETWEIRNETHMDHPFHLHGTRFQVVKRRNHDGELSVVDVPMWEDTTLVAAEETVWISLRFDDHPGMWMYHCHIFEHAHAGMMGFVVVPGDIP